MTFSKLQLDPAILSAVDDAGYSEPTPIQAAAIPVILKGRDMIGIAQTGTGKTAAFTLPLLSLLAQRKPQGKGIRALIVAPTRELVTQIRDNIQTYSKNLNLKIAAIYGGVGERPQIQALRQGAEIVIATPGRLIDLMDQGHVRFDGIEFFVLDEADRMLDMGFLPPIRKIARKLPQHRQSLFFSATLSKQIEQLSKDFLNKPEKVEIGRRSNPADTVEQSIYELPKHLKFEMLVKLLEKQEFYSVLVFCGMKHQADRISKRLRQHEIESQAIHGNRSQNQRQRALDSFKSGDLRVLVATDVAARGIDVSGVTHVINYDFPSQNEDYIHRIGRTGRAGQDGTAITFIEPGQQRDLFHLEKFIKRELPRVIDEDFDYSVPAPPREERPPRGPRQPRQQRSPRGGGSGGGSDKSARKRSRRRR